MTFAINTIHHFVQFVEIQGVLAVPLRPPVPVKLDIVKGWRQSTQGLVTRHVTRSDNLPPHIQTSASWVCALSSYAIINRGVCNCVNSHVSEL